VGESVGSIAGLMFRHWPPPDGNWYQSGPLRTKSYAAHATPLEEASPPMAAINPPFRADQVGSMMRPPQIFEARKRYAEKEITDADLRAVEDAAIREIVAVQEKLGFKSITDGEFRRRSYIIDFFQKALGPDGLGFEDSLFFHKNDKGDRVVLEALLVRGKARWNGPIFADHFAFVKSITSRTPKVTLPSPAILHFLGGDKAIIGDAYSSADAFWADIIEVYRSELAALAKAGCTYVQFDETSIVKIGDPEIRATLAGRGDDWKTSVEKYVELLNAAMAAAPSSITTGIHVCRGNRRGFWQADAGYEFMADQLFRRLKAAFYFLEFDSPRAGPLDALNAMPDDKTVILGLISTKSPELEPKEMVLGRIREAARYVPMERLGLSTQCGFSGNIGSTAMTIDEQYRKLGHVVDIARAAWPDA
jgi:5-methyltetrahydropteroyltriglutamate--homocysteine methyltransferase